MQDVIWWGSQAEDGPSQRRVHVRIGESELSSSRSVRWAKEVVNALVSGLSDGRFGSPKRPAWRNCPICGECATLKYRGRFCVGCEACIKSTCGRCGFVECACLGGPFFDRTQTPGVSELERKRVGS